jgi:hypothetical protein
VIYTNPTKDVSVKSCLTNSICPSTESGLVIFLGVAGAAATGVSIVAGVAVVVVASVGWGGDFSVVSGSAAGSSGTL